MSKFVKNMLKYLHGSKIIVPLRRILFSAYCTLFAMSEFKTYFYSVVNALDCCSRLRNFQTLNNPK